MSRRGLSVGVPLVIGLAVVVAAVLVIRMAPESSTASRAAAETEHTVRDLPNQFRRLLREAQDRYARARSAFQIARAESERALISQLQEAKERGSVPPL